MFSALVSSTEPGNWHVILRGPVSIDLPAKDYNSAKVLALTLMAVTECTADQN